MDRRSVMLIREADAAGGWRFLAVRVGNRLKALTFGSRRQRFHFRTRAEWLACLAGHGLHADVRSMGAGTPFAHCRPGINRRLAESVRASAAFSTATQPPKVLTKGSVAIEGSTSGGRFTVAGSSLCVEKTTFAAGYRMPRIN